MVCDSTTTLNPTTPSSNPYAQHFRMPSGDDRDLVIPVSEPLFDDEGEPVLDAEGEQVMVPVDLTGAALTWELKRPSKESDPDLPALLSKTLVNGGIEVDLGDTSVAIVHINSEDTEELAGKFDHELQVIDTTGHVSTATRGKATIFKDTVV
jgi:hypothetical protein